MGWTLLLTSPLAPFLIFSSSWQKACLSPVLCAFWLAGGHPGSPRVTQGWTDHNNAIPFGGFWFRKGCEDINSAQGDVGEWLLESFWEHFLHSQKDLNRDMKKGQALFRPPSLWSLQCEGLCSQYLVLWELPPKISLKTKASCWVGKVKIWKVFDPQWHTSLNLWIHWSWSGHSFPYCLRKMKGR